MQMQLQEFDTKKKKAIIKRYKGDCVSFNICKKTKDMDVVGYFTLQDINANTDNTDTNKDNDILCIESMNKAFHKYKVTKKAMYSCKGYTYIGDNKWLGYCSKSRLYILLFLLIITLLTIVCKGKIFTSNPAQDNASESNVTTENSGGGYDLSNMDDLLHSGSSSNTLSVPQFSELFVSNGIYIPLVNLPYNKILMKYEVYDSNNTLVFESSEPISPNSEDRWYLNGYNQGDYYFTIIAYKVDEQGNKGNSVSFNTVLHFQ